MLKGEKPKKNIYTPIEPSAFVEEELENHPEEELKTVASGVLVAMHRLGKLPIIPPAVSVKALVNVACFAVDHAKTIVQIAKREISLTQGLACMARDSFAAVKGVFFGADGKIAREHLAERIPILKKPLALVNQISEGITNLVGNEEVRETIRMTRERVVPIVQDFAGEFVTRAVETVKGIGNRIKNFLFG